MNFGKASHVSRSGRVPSSDDSQDRFSSDTVADETYREADQDRLVLHEIGMARVEVWQVMGARQRRGGAWEHALVRAHAALRAQHHGDPNAPRRIADARERCAAVMLAAQLDNPLSTALQSSLVTANVSERAGRGAAAQPPEHAPAEFAVGPGSARWKSRRPGRGRRNRTACCTSVSAFGRLRRAGPWRPLGESVR